MFNFGLFIISVMLYWGLWRTIGEPLFGIEYDTSQLLLIIFLCIPFNFKGEIITILGSMDNEEANITSVFSVFQNGKNTFSIFGTLIQTASKNAIIALGVNIFQESGKNSIIGVGCSLFQKSDNRSLIGIGAAIYQKSLNGSIVFIGIAGRQVSEKMVDVLAGISFHQKVKIHERFMAVYSKIVA